MRANLGILIKSVLIDNLKNKDLQVYYDEDFPINNSQDIPEKEYPLFTIIFDKNMENKFVVSGTEDGYYKFIKGNDNFSLKTWIRYVTEKYSKISTNNHVAIYVNNPAQQKYLDSIKPLFNKLIEYKDKRL
ncbi:MAG: hypothetical protein ACP5NV_01490 [Candidatus Woesearchaeota archaeon]